MSEEEESTVYAAVSPKYPGTAFAVCVDDPKFPKFTAKTVAAWIKRGAQVVRVPRSEAVEMLNRWMDLQMENPEIKP